jgi:hypothetical protein
MFKNRSKQAYRVILRVAPILTYNHYIVGFLKLCMSLVNILCFHGCFCVHFCIFFSVCEIVPLNLQRTNAQNHRRKIRSISIFSPIKKRIHGAIA